MPKKRKEPSVWVVEWRASVGAEWKLSASLLAKYATRSCARSVLAAHLHAMGRGGLMQARLYRVAEYRRVPTKRAKGKR